MKSSLLLFLLFLTTLLNAESFTKEEKLQGYALNNENVIFVFDPAIYNVNPDKVIVTGNFRGWMPV